MEYVYSRSEVLQGQFTVDRIKIIIYQLRAVTQRSKHKTYLKVLLTPQR